MLTTGCWVHGDGYRAMGTGCWLQSAGCKDAWYRVIGTWYRVHSARILGIINGYGYKVQGLRLLGAG